MKTVVRESLDLFADLFHPLGLGAELTRRVDSSNDIVERLNSDV
jgi:hypothetical protein